MPSVHPNDTLDLQLVWRAIRDVSRDYAVFTHLTDASGDLIAQDDAWPDRFNFPTSVWFPGDTRVDDYRLKLVNAESGVYQISVGMYERPSLNRLQLVGGPPGRNEIVLGRLKVSRSDQVFGEPRVVDSRNDVLGGQIALVGSHFEPIGRSGASLVVDLAWRSIRSLSADLTIFAHLLDQSGQVVGQIDSPPEAGRYPTSWWDPGDTIYDRLAIPLPAELSPGPYQIEVGLYHPDSGDRLAVVDGAGQSLGDRILLAGPTVR